MAAVITAEANPYEEFARLCQRIINQPRAVVQAKTEGAILVEELLVKF